MSRSPLLVPMQLDIMVLNRMASITTPFLRFQMQYRNLRSFNTPEPAPFAGASTRQPEAGAYLHWTLPKALRHGRHRDDGTTEFPLVPNRWLIVRTQEGVPPDQGVKAWILESDYLDAKAGTSPFVDPKGMDAAGTPVPTRIGRALRFTPALTSLARQPKPFLRAVGPGSVYFAIFSPGVENVLAFYDDMTANDDRTPIAQGRFTYAVTGWYSDPEHDPLRGTSWKPGNDTARPGMWRNDTLDWLLYAAGPELPTAMLVHAVVPGVPWDRGAESQPAANYPTNIQEKVKVAVGNTAVDALSGMVRLAHGSEAEADLLEAFQYGLLDEFNKPGSSEALNMAIRQHWFGASPGGTLWEIVARERSDDTALAAPPAPGITPQQSTKLAALNAAQEELDRGTRLLESMRWNLYALWWKTSWQNVNDPPLDADMQQWLATQLPLQIGIDSTCADPAGTDPAAERWYACKVTAQKNLVDELTRRCGDAKKDLTRILDAQQELKPTNLPEYFSPNDPVILITGLGRSTNFDPGTGIRCRVPSQTVNALTVAGTLYTAAQGGTDISARIPGLDDPNGLLPAGARELHVESFFLSPTLFARSILGDAGRAGDVRTGIDALPGPAVDVRTAPEAFAREAWRQPWVPLLLDWEITLLKEPAYSCGKDQPTCTLNQKHWKFNGTDYVWNGPTAAGHGNFDEADSLQMQLSGRTFITPQISFTLADQLKDYVRQHAQRDPDLEKLLQRLDDYIEEIRGQDILSQRLSGMTAMMTGRDPAQSVPPSGPIAGAIGEYRNGHPRPSPNRHASYAQAVWDFAPMRGTFFVINRLTVIDTFGRSINLMLANESRSPQTRESVAENYFFPITGRDVKSPTAKDPGPGRGMAADPTERMIQLPPRMAHDSQLRLRLISNDARNADIHRTAGVTPVCGWVVHNHLNRSLAFYAPDGSAWGELYLSRRFQESFLPVWERDPTNPAAPGSIEEIPNVYVRDMLLTLKAREDNGRALLDFITSIDETLWTINPLGQRKDEHLSVLIGRPLAIVRAEMSLRMRGLPPVNQDWWNTFAVDQDNLPDPSEPAPLAAVDGDVRRYLWPVRLGSTVLRNDGLIGYFLDDPASPNRSFATFNALRIPAEPKSDYLKPVGDGNYVALRYVDDATPPDAGQSQVARMTMLVDPRGSIHAFSGILPVVSLGIPGELVKPALEKMFFTFRAGPLLTSPDEVRVPRPAEQQGRWSWFDHVLELSVPLAEADGRIRFPTTPPLIKEGWLKFTPNPTNDHE